VAKVRHHFVPQFYLRAFQSGRNRLNIFNLTNDKLIPDASLRDQCYKRKFHGKTDQLENKLADLENVLAPAFAKIRDGDFPRVQTQAHSLLITFVALQLLRTSVAATRMNIGVDKLTRKAFDGDPRLEGIDLEQVEVGYENPVFLSLATLEAMIFALDDLQLHFLLATGQQRFITSDNPVFKYNQYCEGINDVGITGGTSQGLQLFIPVSPTLLMILYDPSVYKSREKNAELTRTISNADVDALNQLQVVGAEQNLYFTDWNDADYVRRVSGKAKSFRSPDPVQVNEFFEVGNEKASSLIQLFERTPNLKLDLSFITIKRRAKRIPTIKRAHSHRKEMPQRFMPTQHFEPGAPFKRIFIRRDVE
jgi:Protein of unknown function (DUF4238)